jgi:hypothetical protein
MVGKELLTNNPMTQEIYQLQNLIENYNYTYSKDKNYIRLVAEQDKLLSQLNETEKSEVIENLLHGNYPKKIISKVKMTPIISEMFPDEHLLGFKIKNPNPRKLPVLLPIAEKPLPVKIMKQILIEEQRSEEEFRRANGRDDD